MQSDPDGYFQGTYNWYLTGGSVDVGVIDGKPIVFHLTGRDLSNLCIFDYTSGHSTPKTVTSPEPVIRFKRAMFEVLYDRQHLIVRSKMSVELFWIHPIPMQLDLLVRCKGNVPFVCASLSHDEKHLICLDVDHCLRVVPIDASTASREMSLAPLLSDQQGDKWAHLISLDEDFLVLVSRSKLLLIDNHNMECTDTIDFKQVRMMANCSIISGIWRSKLSTDMVYVTTSHDVFALKLTVSPMESRLSIKVCIRWTHQLKSEPIALKSTLVDGSKEVIFVTSQAPNNTRVLLVEQEICKGPYRAEDKDRIGWHSYSPPLKPSDPAESLNTCLEMGLFAETNHDLRPRITKCTTGIAIFPSVDPGFGIVTLITMNSQGDLFHQQMKPLVNVFSHDEELRDLNTSMAEFRNIVRQLDTRDRLTITSMENLKPMFFEAIGDHQSVAETECEKHQKSGRRRPKWNRPVAQLKRYKDVLSQDMLAIWDVSDGDTDSNLSGELGDGDGNGTMQRYLPPADKVSFWLHSNATCAPTDNEFYDPERLEPLEDASFENLLNVSTKSAVKRRKKPNRSSIFS